MNEKFMELALKLAEKGRGKVNPNPLVGAIIVKDGRIIGEGYHRGYGGAHAEVNAFRNCIDNPVGGSMYVTLEPCSHFGKTPPCADLIIKSGVKKVFVGCLDPNPLVSGKGIEKLKNAGIDVEVGVLEDKCKKINEVFMKYITYKKPFVVFKTAMSLDGKISTKTGESMWITCEKSRETVHKLRGELTGIMVGVGTVIKDNPRLTCRVEGFKNPVRIVVDSRLRIPIDSNILSDEARTIIATTEKYDSEKAKELKERNIEILEVKSKNEKVDLNDLMIKLGELSIDSLLIEGGASLGFSSFEEGIVDKVLIYVAPKLIGGTLANSPLGGAGIESLKEAFRLKDMKSEKSGDDILISAYLDRGEK